MRKVLAKARKLYALKGGRFFRVPGHEGGRNVVYVLKMPEGGKRILRISPLTDRTEEDYLAETEFMHYLRKNGASVTDVLPSVNGKFAEYIEENGQPVYLALFEYAPGMLISDNGYRYREGAPLSEYFYNTGKTLGKIHALSKKYRPVHCRGDYFDKYNMDYIGKLIPERYRALQEAIARRLAVFSTLPRDKENYGLVHFDFSDGNYHIDMETGQLTVFDFDNCMHCWYMFDLANLWTHGVGWFQFDSVEERREEMKDYFDTVVKGYRSETEISDEMLSKLQLFIDMVLIENVVDEFECCLRENEEPEEEDIEDEMNCLVNDVPFAGFFEEE